MNKYHDCVGAALQAGDVVRYRYAGNASSKGKQLQCSYFQGEVVSVGPDFGGDPGGGVRLAATIAPWPEARRTEALRMAAHAAAHAAVQNAQNNSQNNDGLLPPPFDPTCVAIIGVDEIVEARLIGGLRFSANDEDNDDGSDEDDASASDAPDANAHIQEEASRMTVMQLRAALKKKDLTYTGVKKTLVARYVENYYVPDFLDTWTPGRLVKAPPPVPVTRGGTQLRGMGRALETLRAEGDIGR